MTDEGISTKETPLHYRTSQFRLWYTSSSAEYLGSWIVGRVVVSCLLSHGRVLGELWISSREECLIIVSCTRYYRSIRHWSNATPKSVYERKCLFIRGSPHCWSDENISDIWMHCCCDMLRFSSMLYQSRSDQSVLRL